MPTCEYMQKDCSRFTGENGEGPPITVTILDVNDDIMWDNYCNHECMLQDMLKNLITNKPPLLERFKNLLEEFSYIENHTQMDALLANNKVVAPPPPIPIKKVAELRDVKLNDHFLVTEELAKMCNLLTAPLDLTMRVQPFYHGDQTRPQGMTVLIRKDRLDAFGKLIYDPDKSIYWATPNNKCVQLSQDGVFQASKAYNLLSRVLYAECGIRYPDIAQAPSPKNKNGKKKKSYSIQDQVLPGGKLYLNEDAIKVHVVKDDF